MTDKEQGTLSPIKRALLAMKKLQSEVDTLHQKRTEPIAVIGMGCRFPGADSPEAFWQLLSEGRDAISEVPTDRFTIDDYYDPDPDAPGKMWTRCGGFVDHLADFDAHFFGISPNEALSFDPQHRLVLEVAWEALENAALTPDQLPKNTGVFMGIDAGDYLRHLLRQGATAIDPYLDTGNSYSMASGRLSYFLGAQGPSFSIDTACSSSLVAVHQAVMSLRNGECDLAFAGGVNRISDPALFINYTKSRAISPDGHCKSFDASADGFSRSEGCGVIILKRLSDAQADGDSISAVIRGSAINQDGRTSGLTVPNGLAQQSVVRQALANGAVSPSEVSYLEAHGTGTSLGDPIEVEALGNVFNKRTHPLVIGSAKSNFGHLEAAAGIAGLMKVVLSLQHDEIPPNLHFKNPNPLIDWDNLPIKIPTERMDWPLDGGKFAGVSSFGFSGTNAHVVLAAAPVQTEESPEEVANQNVGVAERPLHLLTLSAKTEQALTKLAERYIAYLPTVDSSIPEDSQQQLANIGFTTNTGRTHFDHRLVVVAESTTQAQKLLNQSNVIKGHRINKPRVAFLFTGQGSQYVDMGRQLYATLPVFRHELERCNEILQPYLEHSLLSVLHPEDGSRTIDGDDCINQTAYTQPVLFAFEYAIAKVWQSWGITPDVVMGHSVGEYVAACIAGVFSLEDGLRLIVERGRLMQSLPNDGEMAVIFADEVWVSDAIRDKRNVVSIAAINGPESVVISGAQEAVQQLVEAFNAQGIKSIKLTVSHAFHSPLMQPMLKDFERIAKQVSYAEPTIDFVSNLTGELVTTPLDASYWLRHITEPVKFYDGMKTLDQDGYNIFLEIGPKPTLLGMARHCLPDNTAQWLPSLRPDSEWKQLLDTLAQLYVSGLDVDWNAFHDMPRQRVTLPTYPYQRKRYWLDGVGMCFTPATEVKDTTENSKYSTSVSESLNQGDTNGLTAMLANQGDFNEEQLTLLNDAMQLLVDEHQQQYVSPLNEWLYHTQWRSFDKPKKIFQQESDATWLIFADQSGVGERLAGLLQKQGQKSLLVFAKRGEIAKQQRDTVFTLSPETPAGFEYLAQTLQGSPLHKIIHLWSLDIPNDKDIGQEALQLGCGSMLHLLQAFSSQEMDDSAAPIWIITRGAVAVGKELESAVAINQAPLWGMGRVMALEHPRLWGGMIDLPHQTVPKDAAELLLAMEGLQEETGEDVVALRAGICYAPRLVKGISESTATPTTLKPESTYLITGGLGSLGLLIAHWMIKQGATHLLLTGRSGAKGKENEVRMLEEAGVCVNVVQADIANINDASNVFSAVSSMPPLRGIIHAAGVLDDGILEKQTLPRFEKVMAPKAQGAWNLHKLSQEKPLDFFILFSSDTSLIGTSGQANYSAANAFLDALAHYRTQKKMPALSINWGSWADIGMAAKVGKEHHASWAAHGIGTIPPARGLQRLQRLLGCSGQVGVMRMDWSKYRVNSPLLRELVQQPDITTDTQKTISFKEQLGAVPLNERNEKLTIYLQQEVAKVLGMDDVPDPNQGFFDMGIDSLMTMNLRNSLQTELDTSLPSTLAFEYPTIEKLVDYLLQKIFPKQETKTENHEKPKDVIAQEAIEQLSAEELLSELSFELEGFSQTEQEGLRNEH